MECLYRAYLKYISEYHAEWNALKKNSKPVSDRPTIFNRNINRLTKETKRCLTRQIIQFLMEKLSAIPIEPKLGGRIRE